MAAESIKCGLQEAIDRECQTYQQMAQILQFFGGVNLAALDDRLDQLDRADLWAHRQAASRSFREDFAGKVRQFDNLADHEWYRQILLTVEAGEPIDNDVATAVLDYVEQHRGL